MGNSAERSEIYSGQNQLQNTYRRYPAKIRDGATIEQLIVLSSLESINAILIHQRVAQPERLQKLNDIAIMQMRSLLTSPTVKKLRGGNG